jgi:hypothetical protein
MTVEHGHIPFSRRAVLIPPADSRGVWIPAEGKKQRRTSKLVFKRRNRESSHGTGRGKQACGRHCDGRIDGLVSDKVN